MLPVELEELGKLLLGVRRCVRCWVGFKAAREVHDHPISWLLGQAGSLSVKRFHSIQGMNFHRSASAVSRFHSLPKAISA